MSIPDQTSLYCSVITRKSTTNWPLSIVQSPAECRPKKLARVGRAQWLLGAWLEWQRFIHLSNLRSAPGFVLGTLNNRRYFGSRWGSRQFQNISTEPSSGKTLRGVISRNLLLAVVVFSARSVVPSILLAIFEIAFGFHLV